MKTLSRHLRTLGGPALLLGVTLAAVPAQAEVSLPSVLGSHMVLQRGQDCPVWGWADPGETVTVKFGAQSHSTHADASGNWMVRLRPMKANSKPQTLTIRGKNTLSLDDVLVGEVWLCSGQSNMEWSVSNSDNPQQEIAAANHPRIRHIKIPHRPSTFPEKNVPSEGWTVASPATVGNYTAVGYFFARELQKELDVPVGLLGSNWGGTRIEPWIPPVGFQQVPALKDIADKLDTFPQVTYRPSAANPLRTERVINFQTSLALYNGMIHPLVPFAIRGALWYQGESNNGEGMLYYEKMKALVGGWRSVWNNPEMPFLFVQLAPYKYGGDQTRLAGIWDAQRVSLTIPHTGMAVT
ncbi:MAG: sialate O-acetylesterase, partial [Actinomycetota bacterium]